MLCELRVQDLGVIEDITLLLGPGMTVLTGETGAGKTLLVEAISLLTGAASSPSLVRPGAAQATIEARFSADETSDAHQGGDGAETILRKVVPSSGRSRAYSAGRMVVAAELSDIGRALVDLHGQHAHQSLLSPTSQRRALDVAGRIDSGPMADARRRLRALRDELGGLGGDARARALELEVLRHHLDEIDRAGIGDESEEVHLREEEESLSDAENLRAAALEVWARLAADDGVNDVLGRLISQLADRPSLSPLRERLSSTREELVDSASEALRRSETSVDDPERLEEIRARLRSLGDLRKRYGETLADVIRFREDTQSRLVELEGFEARAAEIEADVSAAEHDVAEATSSLYAARQSFAPLLSKSVTTHLHELAMPKARFDIEVSETAEGGRVTWMLAANPGQPLLPLDRAASGGELARTMLAARLAVLDAPTDAVHRRRSKSDRGGEGAGLRERTSRSGPFTLVFDEVDAGVGGEAAVAVGRALHALSGSYQVLVVTHLPQVASFAEHHLVVRKESALGSTSATVAEVSGSDRVIELARMLSGRPDSETARLHALELLGSAGGPPPVG